MLRSRMKHAGVSWRTWLTSSMALVEKVMSRDDVEAILHSKSWSAVAGQVARLTSGSRLGACIFDFARKLVNAEHFKQFIDQCLQEFLETPTYDYYQQCVFTMEAKAQELKEGHVLEGKRQIMVQMLDKEVAMTVQDLSMEWELRASGAIRAAALGRTAHTSLHKMY